jgi:hypothetical protein
VHSTECVNCESSKKCCNNGRERKIITQKSKAFETDMSQASKANLIVCTVISTPKTGVGRTEDDGETPGVWPLSDEYHDAVQVTPPNNTDDEIGHLPDYICVRG